MKIGLRIPGACGREPFADFARWCKDDGFDAIDLYSPDPERIATVRAAGLDVGTVDLAGTGQLLSPDPAERDKGIAAASNALAAMGENGVTKAFCVFVPRDGSQSRRDSFDNWKQAFPAVVAAAEQAGVRIAMEGWPGGGPHYAALGVTPETWRAMFDAVPSPNFGLNFDPSHLARIGVDHVRALDEFASRVIHVHGKDTAFDSEALYRHGNLGPVWENAPGFSEGWWRYTIPGEGFCNWQAITARLAREGFDGTISIELEDFRYNGSIEGEKRGLSRAKNYLMPLL